MRRNPPRFCFIGFGEAGQALASGLRETGVETMAAWDILFPEPAGGRLREAAERIGVRIAKASADAFAGADVIVAAVTAASSLDAARTAKPHLSPGQVWLDVNSVSPHRKRETAGHLDGAVRYVDVAIMAPVHPARHRTPMLLAGPHAEAVAPLLTDLDMRVASVGENVGAAAAIKMVRSVMVKGMEALTFECFLAAARAGVEDHIVASLSESFPGLDWSQILAYNLERMAVHGIRRAHEMEEVAETLAELGVAPYMATATAAHQRYMGELGVLPAVKDALQDGAALLRTIELAARHDKK